MKKKRVAHSLVGFLVIVAFAGPFVLGGDTYAALDATGPNLFSLINDTVNPVAIVRSGDTHRLWWLGLYRYTTGRIHTVGDALAATNTALSAGQASALGLCQPLAAGQDIVIPASTYQRGIASWYGPGFHGQLAAAGETYNMYALTAAHRTLPLGSLVRVTYPVTGESVVVRINDRGPYANGRIIDLSYAAKRKLGMDDIASVYLERIDPDALDVPCQDE